MANHKSAIKRIRQTERRNEINSRVRASLRTQIKKLSAALEAADGDACKVLWPATVSAVDSSAQAGVIHRNTAARMKSRLNARVKKLATAAAA